MACACSNNSSDPYADFLTLRKQIDDLILRIHHLNSTVLHSPNAKNANTGFLLICSSLVFVMTPGLGFFYAGMARCKNALSLIMLCYLSMAVVLLQWLICGFSLSFGSGDTMIGTFYYWGGTHIGDSDVPFPSSETPTNSSVFFIYQAMFACITAAIIFGSTAERVRLLPAVFFIVIWTTLVYDFIAHWTWSESGWLANLRPAALDFAGGGPVHIASGFSGLAKALVIGKRDEFKAKAKEWKPHNLSYVMLGTGLLWMGWFAFNGGSALTGGSRAAMAATVTNIAAASGGLTWIFFDFPHQIKLSALGFCSGAVAGLVGITPGAGYVAPWAAVLIGAVTSLCCNLVCRLKHICGYDDALDAFGVHGVGGFVGCILTGIFAQKWVSALDGNTTGLRWGGIDGNWLQVVIQLAAATATAMWSFGITIVITLMIPLRVTTENEQEGVDLTEMGEQAYEHHCGQTSINTIDGNMETICETQAQQGASSRTLGDYMNGLTWRWSHVAPINQ